jgi:hypothetical protein
LSSRSRSLPVPALVAAAGDQARVRFLEFFAATIRNPHTPAAPAHHQRREAIKRVNAERETLGEIARSCNVSRWTISRLIN